MLAVQSVKFNRDKAKVETHQQGVDDPVAITIDDVIELLESIGMPIDRYKMGMYNDCEYAVIQIRKLEDFKESVGSRYCNITLQCGEIEDSIPKRKCNFDDTCRSCRFWDNDRPSDDPHYDQYVYWHKCLNTKKGWRYATSEVLPLGKSHPENCLFIPAGCKCGGGEGALYTTQEFGCNNWEAIERSG